ncbi:hypothetical protein ACFL6M_00855 [Candidatus Eisenbacteria bacterium]|uniref:Thioredoxin family protein n=1 Tax=Eiseniibacteriota bacterium TaxID=2212470 RepID=A0ABV6YIF5_UNCEI
MKRSGLLLGFLAGVTLLMSCTSEQPGPLEAHSLEGAKNLAAEHGAVILVDFWKHN